MKKIFLLLLVVLPGIHVFAQVKDTAVSKNPFFSSFELRQSFQTPDAQLNPAQLQLTIPETGRSNWLVDAGISLTMGKLSVGPLTSKLIAEVHRNTLVDDQQYNYQAGYNLTWYKDKGDYHATAVWTGNLKYIRDKIDSSKSFAATLNFSIYRSGKNSLNLGRPGYLSHQKYTYQLTPSVEAQYQQVFTADKQATGVILRPVLDIAASFAINKKKEKGKLAAPSKLVELALDYVNRYAIINSRGNSERYTKLLRPAINYYLLNTSSSSVAIGASYNLGSDPLNGLKAQQFWLFSLQVQL